MEQTEPDIGWFWSRAFILLLACSGAVVGLNIFLYGADALSNPSGAGEAVGSSLAVWALGGIAPAIAYFAKKSPRETLLKAWIAGCCVVFGLTTFWQTYAPLNKAIISNLRTDYSLEKKTGYGGFIYCVTTFEVAKEVGLPEQWSEKFRVNFVEAIKEASATGAWKTDKGWDLLLNNDFFLTVYTRDKDNQLNLETEKVDEFWQERAKEEFKYALPCATVLDDNKFKAYVAERIKNKQQDKRNELYSEKTMECLYEHRKEINDLNRAAINHECHKRAKKYAGPVP